MIVSKKVIKPDNIHYKGNRLEVLTSQLKLAKNYKEDSPFRMFEGIFDAFIRGHPEGANVVDTFLFEKKSTLDEYLTPDGGMASLVLRQIPLIGDTFKDEDINLFLRFLALKFVLKEYDSLLDDAPKTPEWVFRDILSTYSKYIEDRLNISFNKRQPLNMERPPLIIGRKSRPTDFIVNGSANLLELLRELHTLTDLTMGVPLITPGRLSFLIEETARVLIKDKMYSSANLYLTTQTDVQSYLNFLYQDKSTETAHDIETEPIRYKLNLSNQDMGNMTILFNPTKDIKASIESVNISSNHTEIILKYPLVSNGWTELIFSDMAKFSNIAEILSRLFSNLDGFIINASPSYLAIVELDTRHKS